MARQIFGLNYRASPRLLKWAAAVGVASLPPASSFAAFAAYPAKETIVLVELTPGYILGPFTKTGGRAFVYQYALSRFETGGLMTSGWQVYRPVIGVQENATSLTAVGDVGTCDATAGSYYWDEASGILYVHTSGGGSPNSYTSYFAYVRFYIGSRGIVLNQVDGDERTAVYYVPWLSAGSDAITQQMSDALAGITTTETTSLTLTNGHGFWNTIVARDGRYLWKNKTFQLLVGGNYNGLSLTRSQYVAWTTQLVEGVASDELVATFTLKPQARATEQELPITPFFSDSYPNLGSGVSGTKKWIGYGRATITPDLVDTSGNGVYVLADAAFQTLFAVNAVVAINAATQARTTLAVGVDYTVNLTTCVLTILNPVYAWQNATFEVDLTGKPDGAGSYLKTGAAIVQDILQTFLGVPTSMLDTAAFTQAAIDAPQELAVWLKSPRSIASILDGAEPQSPSIAKSIMASFNQTLAGYWTMFIWKPGVDPATALALRKQDFAVFSAQPKLSTVYGSTRVYYAENGATGTWANQLANDLKTQYQTGTTDPFEVYTYLTNASHATVLAQRYQLISGAVSLEIEFEERGALTALAKAGDKVLVTFDPAPIAAGKFDSYPMELLRVDRSLVPVLAMKGRLGDLRGIGAKVGTWQSVGGSGVAWADATTTQQQTYGFWTDASGYIVPGDESTRHKRIWW